MKVSICLITYNHEAFIAQAIDSVLMQQTTFDYELVIGEDCSTDSTRRIIEDYQQRNPGTIRLLPANSRNIGMMKNFMQVFSVCDGEFMAFLDGDDYWTDPHKLQMQVDFLTAHPDYVGCFTDYVTTADGKEADPQRPTPPPTAIPNRVTLEILVRGNLMATSTVVCRKMVQSLPRGFERLPMGDWPLHVLQAVHGDFHYLPVQTACYRIHHQNAHATTALEKKVLREIHVLEFLIDRLPLEVSALVQVQRLERYEMCLQMRGTRPKRVLYVRFRLARTRGKSLESWVKSVTRVLFRRGNG